jgi:methylamine--corrinoid protein Co-methyltransferase
MGEAAKTAAGMKVSDLNETILKVLALYDKNFAAPPQGKSFRECYDVKTVKPTAEYLAVYDQAVQSLRDAGLPIKH